MGRKQSKCYLHSNSTEMPSRENTETTNGKQFRPTDWGAFFTFVQHINGITSAAALNVECTIKQLQYTDSLTIRRLGFADNGGHRALQTDLRQVLGGIEGRGREGSREKF